MNASLLNSVRAARVNNDFEYMVPPITEDDIGSHALAGQSKGSIVLAP